MTWVDLAVLGFIGISGLLAFGRGFVREVLGLGAWAGAVAIAIFLLPVARDPVSNYIHTPAWVDPAAFAVVFFCALIILMVTASIIGNVVRGSALGGVDRTLGLVFGLVRGAAIVTVAYIIGGLLSPVDKWPSIVLQARSITPTYWAASWVRTQLPDSVGHFRLEAPPETREATAEALFRATPQGRATEGRAAEGRAGGKPSE